MNYLCLIYHSREAFEAMSPQQSHAMQLGCAEEDERLEAAGRLVIARALREPETARRVSRRGRKTIVTDGPFAESKEQIVGLLILEADSMDEAIELAAQSPLAETGTIEVREAYRFHRGLIEPPA